MKKCNKCNKEQDDDQFIGTRGVVKKCLTCREKMKCLCGSGKRKQFCKDCGGSQICPCGKQKAHCKDCSGSQICPCGKSKNCCEKHGGSALCDCCKKQKAWCEKIGERCSHDILKVKCPKHSSAYCECEKDKRWCKKHGPCCEHDILKIKCPTHSPRYCGCRKLKYQCQKHDPIGHLTNLTHTRINKALNGEKKYRTVKYLGCTIKKYRIYLEEQFLPGMSWDNHGEWHIDHKIPIKYGDPTMDQVIERLHYTNTQPLWAVDNISKGNRYCHE